MEIQSEKMGKDISLSWKTPVFSMQMKYLFPSPHFQFMYAFCPMVSLLSTADCRLFFFFFFLILFATLCLLIGAFSALTFKVIIDKYVFSHFKPCLPVDSLFLLCSFLFMVGWFSFILCLHPFLFSVFECTVWFWYVVALFLKYVNPFLYICLH